jgi:hypothetical protein
MLMVWNGSLGFEPGGLFAISASRAEDAMRPS